MFSYPIFTPPLFGFGVGVTPPAVALTPPPTDSTINAITSPIAVIIDAIVIPSSRNINSILPRFRIGVVFYVKFPEFAFRCDSNELISKLSTQYIYVVQSAWIISFNSSSLINSINSKISIN